LRSFHSSHLSFSINSEMFPVISTAHLRQETEDFDKHLVNWLWFFSVVIVG
jgi:hypothetical protein